MWTVQKDNQVYNEQILFQIEIFYMMKSVDQGMGLSSRDE